MSILNSRRSFLVGSAGLISTAAFADGIFNPGANSVGDRGLVPTYFVNSATGLDTNDGKTAASAWQTIAKVNASTFQPNDVIGFAGGQTFSGTLTPPSSGSALAKITFMSYGIGRATITPAASNNGILAVNLSYVTIRDLIVVGTSQTTHNNDGVFVQNNQAGNTKLPGISLINLDVSLFGLYGIHIRGQNGTSGFTGLSILNCVAHDNTGATTAIGSAGIHVRASGYGSGATTPSHTNITIAGCVAFNNIGNVTATPWSGHGIVMSQTGTGVIQNCVAHDNGASGTASVGIWTYDSVGVVIQFCEAYNHTNASGYNTDGEGFDIDGGCHNCLMQFNYSHNNFGAGFLLYAYNDGSVTTWDNNTCRYNISQNDGISGNGNVPHGLGGIAVWNAAAMTNAFVYNNTVYNSNSSRVMTVIGSMTGNVANNIFYAGASIDIVNATATSLIFTGNDYFSTGAFSINWAGTAYSTFAAWQTATSQEKIGGVNVGLTSDPSLVIPGGGGTIGGYNPAQPSAYMLHAGSPMIGTGLDMNAQFAINPGTQDFYGNTIPRGGLFPVGAYAGAGV
jgi:hypothetical protein